MTKRKRRGTQAAFPMTDRWYMDIAEQVHFDILSTMETCMGVV
jgi:hypothetical protein